MVIETICLIEEWQDMEPYSKIKTLSPVFTDMSYAINQVEDLVFAKLLDLRDQDFISEHAFAEAVGQIPFKWISQPSETDDTHVYMHNQPELDHVFTISQLPVLDKQLSDLKIQ